MWYKLIIFLVIVLWASHLVYLMPWEAKFCYSRTFIFSFVSLSNRCAIFRIEESGEEFNGKKNKGQAAMNFSSLDS